jgi:16S rRNA (adenine1518-N6/adenine1519-N6)-dimethyltransferase
MPLLKTELSFWLKKFNIKPSKDLGQCFLVAAQALSKIVAATELKPGDRVLEIGGGTGILTQKLLGKGAEVLTVEKDSRLALVLHERFDQERKNGRLKIIQADFLDLPFPETLERFGWKAGGYKVAANLPYQITSPAIERILERNFLPFLAVLTIQKEVAERICAAPGDLSSLAVLVQACTQKCTLAGKFPPGYFYPKPEVDSALLKLEGVSYEKLIQANSDVDPSLTLRMTNRTLRMTNNNGIDIKQLRQVIRAGFAQKRKKLKKNLQNIFDRETIEKIWKKQKLAENIRAQELPVEQWLALTDALFV